MQKWMNLGVSGQVGWPKKQTEAVFGTHKLILMPCTKDTMASVHIEVSKMDHVAAMSIVNRFLSLLSWCEGQPLINHYGWSGNPVPVAVPAPRTLHCISEFFVFVRHPLEDNKQRLALALYREAQNLNSTPPYQFLSYFKILNVFWNDKKDQKTGKNPLIEGLRETLPLVAEQNCQQRVAATQDQGDDPAKYLYDRRCTIAHAYREPLVDPDEVSHLRSLSEDIDVIRAVAEYLIKVNLGISRCLWEDAPKS